MGAEEGGLEGAERVLRRAGADEEAGPGLEEIAGHGLGDGGHVGQHVGALARGDGQRPHRALLHLADGGGHDVQQRVDALGHQVRIDGARAAIGRVQQLDIGGGGQQHAGEVAAGVGAGGAVADLPGRARAAASRSARLR
jgi:hypothetical protein